MGVHLPVEGVGVQEGEDGANDSIGLEEVLDQCLASRAVELSKR